MASLRRAPVAVACLVAVVVFTCVLVLGTGGPRQHELKAAFTSGLQVFPGDAVTIAGRSVGTVRSLELQSGLAVLTLGIDDRAWPLHGGTIARLRTGSPAGYAQRFVELYPGPNSQPAIPVDAVLGTTSTITPVEVDQIYRMLGPTQRRSLAAFLDNSAATLAGHAAVLRNAISGSAAGLPGIEGLLQDLNSVDPSLGTVVDSGAEVMSTLQQRDAQLQNLVTQAAGTLQSLGGQASAIRATLQGLPPGLSAAQNILRRTNSSLGVLQGTIVALAPGAVQLRRIAPVTLQVVDTLRQVAPRVTALLQRARTAAPAISDFLDSGSSATPHLSSALGGLAPMLACVLPYGPELGGVLAEGDSAFSNYDEFGHYVRDGSFKSGLTVGTPFDAEQLTTLFKGILRYGLVRPPGENAGKPWYLPQCGVTPAGLDPTKDPEAEK